MLPAAGCVFVSVKDADKPWIVEPVRILAGRGFTIIATGGTADLPARARASTVERVKKVLEGRPHIVDAMKNGEVQLVFNTTEGKQSLEDSFSLRRTALMMKIPYYTTAAGALAAAQAIAAQADGRSRCARCRATPEWLDRALPARRGPPRYRGVSVAFGET